MRPTDVLLYGRDSYRQPATRFVYPSTLPAYPDARRLEPRRGVRRADAGLDWQRLWIDLGGEG
jgi:hypothetical protein